jgi:hypothetical protein
MAKEIKIYYECFVNLDANEKSTIEYMEWHITSKSKNGIFIRQKTV